MGRMKASAEPATPATPRLRALDGGRASAERRTAYAERALEQELQEVALSGEGGRNRQLHRSAASLAGLVAAALGADLVGQAGRRLLSALVAALSLLRRPLLLGAALALSL